MASLAPANPRSFYSGVLPALPHGAIAIVDLSKKARWSEIELAEAIECDPGLFGQVLQFMNLEASDHEQVLCVRAGLQVFDCDSILDFAMSHAHYSTVPNPKFGQYAIKLMWQDWLRRATFAREVGRLMNLEDAEDLFSVALLKDMAIPLLMRSLTSDQRTAVDRRFSEGLRLNGIERDFFDWNHVDAATKLAELWGLPTRFASLLTHRTHLGEMIAAGPYMHGNACIALAALIPECDKDDWPENDRQEFIGGFSELTDLPLHTLYDLLISTDQASLRYSPMLRVRPPRTKLATIVKGSSASESSVSND